MAIVFQTSFDHYTTLTHRFNSTSGSGFSVTSGGRNSTNCLQQTTDGFIQKILPLAISTGYMAFSFNTNILPLPTADIKLIMIQDIGTSQLELHLLSNGTFQVRRNGTIVISSLPAFAITSNVTYHLEWKFTIHNSAGVIGLRLNEIDILTGGVDATGLDTQNSANSTIDMLWIGRQANVLSFTGTLKYDDLIVRSDTWSGDSSVQAFLPTGNGATNNFTVTGASNNYQAVDESAPNSDTDYVQSAVVGDIDLYTYGTLSATATIQAVIPIPWAEKTAAGTAKFANIVGISGTTYVGVDQAPSDSSYAYFPEILSTSPATGLTWTTTEFNSIQVGIKRTA